MKAFCDDLMTYKRGWNVHKLSLKGVKVMFIWLTFSEMIGEYRYLAYLHHEKLRKFYLSGFGIEQGWF